MRSLPSGLARWLAAALLLAAAPAWACGIWHLTDDPEGREVAFLIHTVEAGAPGGARKKIFAIGGDRPEELHLEWRGRKAARFRGTRVELDGRPAGTLRGDELRLGDQAYTITLRPHSDAFEVT